MNQKEKAKLIIKILDKYFPHPKIPLYHKNHFTLLIAVVLSANSTDRCVNKVTPKLFQKGSSPQEMIKLTKMEIEKIISPCGLGPSKAKAILALSQMLITKYKGKVPKTFKSLQSLPGVGHKTAAVVLSQAFNKATFPVDTHIHRCAKRWGLTCGKNRRKTEEDLKKIFPKHLWCKLHLQIIYFARQFCPAKNHKIEKCPLCRILNNRS